MIWLITIEVFPTANRGLDVALSVQTNFAMHSLVEMLVPLIQARFEISVVFGMFNIMPALAICFIPLRTPKTTGLSLEEVAEEFVRKMRMMPFTKNCISLSARLLLAPAQRCRAHRMKT